MELTQAIYTVQQVADLLQVEYQTVYRLIRQDRLKAFRLFGETGEYRITNVALLNYMQLAPAQEGVQS